MKPRHYTIHGKPTSKPLILYDKWLILATFGLIIIGLMMVASSSITISTKYYNQPFHFLIRQATYLGIGFILSLIILRINVDTWQKCSAPLLIMTLIMLCLVLIPGIGKVVNGSRRWISLGIFSVQVSEICKLAMVLYVSAYLVRQQAFITQKISSFIKPMLILCIVAALLLAEPDFGATVVISGTIMAMLFLAGVKFRYYIGLLFLVIFALSIMAFSSPYRVERLTTFLNPWADQFNSGYQLTQSLIAFGRGGWFGSGLGEGVQKLFYLPEAHTDFLLAVLAEEEGVIGVVLVIFLYAIMVIRGIIIGLDAHKQNLLFASYTAYGLTFWLAMQAIINISVNTGLLPTKGLTLPFLSYGGASLVLNCIVVAILLRIDHENRWQALGLK